MRPNPPIDIHLGALQTSSWDGSQDDGAFDLGAGVGGVSGLDVGEAVEGGDQRVGPGPGAGSAAFKAKMESLHDKTSTNLYMEG